MQPTETGLIRSVKRLLVLSALAVAAALVFMPSGAPSTARAGEAPPPAAARQQKEAKAEYVGAETCKACHSDQATHFNKTSHAKLETLSSWKGKVVGCESCHGPGSAHVELMGQVPEGEKPAQPSGQRFIRTLKEEFETSKQISNSCLACHSGKEEHSNFRRSEHWRNDVGCTDCHSSHEASRDANIASSNMFVSPANAEKPGFGTEKLLKTSETQLCMSCHTETKHQFSQPFHHKVMEGAMKCGDCHNPHGGFETRQARLSTGADASCLKCHTDKQGPFTYEHSPVKTEGCSACHTPHGSANPRLLKTNRVAQLCLECHSQSHNTGAAQPIGPVHNLNLNYADCTSCHMKVHGSHTSPVFMR
jgi:predicted CXXCH cytochrome family protein